VTPHSDAEPVSLTKSGEAPARVRRTLLLAHASAAIVLGGVQAIIPALPTIQRALQLSDSQIGLVNSAYLLPGVLLAIPAGFLADRYGRRTVYCGALLLFGLAGALIVLQPSFEVLLVLRVVQGTAFAALLPLSVTILGDLLTGPRQVREQGRRMVVITASDTVLPLVGGALVLLAWSAPFAIHLVALPLAVAGWFGLRDLPHHQVRQRFTLGALTGLLRTRMAVAIQVLGVLRFLFKFAALTYAPILLDQRGFTTTAIAAAIAALAATSVLAALSTRWIMRHLRGSTVLSLGLVSIAVAYVVLATVPAPAATVACLLVFGAAEGAFGIVMNAMTLEGVTAEQRATFVASVGAMRNLGKFLAPSVLGLAVLWMPLATAFGLVGLVALASLLAVPPVRVLDARLAGERP
jgi:MFS family permease